MQTEALTINEIEKILWRTPGGQELLALRQREAERKALIAEIQSLREEQRRELPPLKAAAEQAERAALEAREALKRAEAVWRGKHSVHAGVAARLSGWIARREHELRQTASPLIDEFITRCRRAVDAARGSFMSVVIPTGERAFESGHPIVEQKSNGDDIALLVKKIEHAAKEAEKLKLLAIPDEEIAMKLRELAETLPGEDKRQALILLEDRGLGYDLVISERSEMVRQSEPWKNTKRAIRESLGGSFRERRR